MILATLNDLQLPPIEVDFLRSPIEATADVVTLDNSLYTDFSAPNAHAWTFNYDSLTQEQYDAIKDIYDSQFSTYQYPLLSIPFYSITDTPVRMYINEKNIWNHCGDIQNVQLRLRESIQIEPIVTEDDEVLLT